MSQAQKTAKDVRAEVSQPSPLSKREKVRAAALRGPSTIELLDSIRAKARAAALRGPSTIVLLEQQDKAARDELAKLKTALASSSESEVKAAEGSAGST